MFSLSATMGDDDSDSTENGSESDDNGVVGVSGIGSSPASELSALLTSEYDDGVDVSEDTLGHEVSDRIVVTGVQGSSSIGSIGSYTNRRPVR